MQTGIIKFFNESKGYSFIKEDLTNNEVFIHITGLTENVRKDDKVTYDTIEGKKGLNAINVRKIQAS